MKLTSLPARFTIKVRFLTDWQVGSGLGRAGHLDLLVARDCDGLPFLPAKTLTGILRDAAERVAFGLDGGEPSEWHAWVRWLFGDQPSRSELEAQEKVDGAPRAAPLSVRPGRLPQDLRRLLSGDGATPLALRSALVRAKPGVAIDPRSGTARPKFLRLEEVARSELVLDANASIAGWSALREDQRTTVTALLVASCGMADRIGGGRRRGSGRVEVAIREAPGIEAIVQWLDTHPDPGGTPSLAAPKPLPAPQSPGKPDWIRLPLAIEFETPVLIPHRAVGNTVETLDFVPGTYFLSLATRLFRGFDLDAGPSIQCGDLRFAPATPEIAGSAGFPVPFSIFGPKHREGSAWQAGVSNALSETPSPEHVRQFREGYVGGWDIESKILPLFIRPRRVLRTHNTVDEESQRPTEAVGGVFSYLAIEAGCVYRTEFWLRSDLVEQLETRERNWWRSLETDYRIGRSKKDDYGKVRVRLAAEGPLAVKPRVWAVSGSVAVWLVSDALLRDELLRWDPSPSRLRIEFEAALGKKLQVIRTFSRPRRLDSWQVKWGRPRPSLVALQAGSCFELAAADSSDLPVSRLAELELEGVGLRRSEGYGRLRLDDPLLRSPWSTWSPPVGKAKDPPSQAKAALPDSHPHHALARDLERSAWRESIRRAALLSATTPAARRQALGFDRGRPSSTQAGALRQAVTRLAEPGGRERARVWLTHLAQSPNRVERWPEAALAPARGREGGAPAKPTGRLVDLLTDENRVWELFGSAEWPEATEGAAKALRQELWAEAVRALVDAVVRSHQRELQAVEQGVGRDG